MFISFIKPTILRVLLFLAIAYFLVPIFSQPSLCLDLYASEATDKSWLNIPCVKLTTFPQHVMPIYKTENGITYQQNAFYSYDLTVKYVSPILNILFAYALSCGILFILKFIKEPIYKLRNKS